MPEEFVIPPPRRPAPTRLRRSTVLSIAAISVLALIGPGCFGQSTSSARPRITGISHVGYFVSSLPQALDFWHGLLGFDQAYTIPKPGNPTEVRIAFIKINDRQHVELFNEPPTTPPNQMSHLCFSVNDIQQMRAYLVSKGLSIAPISAKTHAGDYAFEIKDPDGTLIEFVQTLPTGMEADAAGKFQPSSRVSSHIYHVGFLVGNAQRSLDFYGGLLGFKETWRGSGNPDELSWINMQVPDGTDYVELMLYRKLPATYGSSNHIALEVPSIANAMTALQSRLAVKNDPRQLAMHIGRNGKRQVNLFDPDGTRVELMEPNTVDGRPVPSSNLPPPPPSHP